MSRRNPFIAALHGSYLFPEIERKTAEFKKNNPDAALISLGIGDTTAPIEQKAAEAMAIKSAALATRQGYSGYGPIVGKESLRKAISQKIYGGKIHPDEIFISDGAKCDIGRLQLLFGPQAKIAVQDPSYPVYVDSAVLTGMGGIYEEKGKGYSNIVYLPCTPENDFFPDLNHIKEEELDLFYFCSPNNPTGAVASIDQLTELVTFAKANKITIIFDAAYSAFIKENTSVKTIYDIEGAKSVAIEVNSFSKLAGFTGVRLGWSVVPQELCYKSGEPIQKDWRRLISTVFNGASNIAQCGGEALLDEKGWDEVLEKVQLYKENSAILRTALEKLGLKVYGGDQAPYLWVCFPQMSSWQIFDYMLERVQLIVTPGSGFGPSGEGYVRLSSFGRREDILQAAERLQNLFN